MDLLIILAATLTAGVGSVWVAGALLRLGVRGNAGEAHGPQNLLSLAAGALLATAFMHLLPEAFHSAVDPSVLFAVLLFGLVLFFLLDKAELWHHGHEHGDAHPEEERAHELAHAPTEGQTHAHSHAHTHSHSHSHAHAHAHAHSRAQAPAQAAGHHHHHHGGGGWSILTGDSVHCFGDGVLIASAFVADWRLGLLAALAVLAHEVPHHVGDLVVLRQSSANAKAALLKVSLAGTVTALGGFVGWLLVEQLPMWLPYLLVLASSSFVYVALADLIPQLQRRLSARQTVSQVAWLVAGILLVTVVSRLAHGALGHSHEHEGVDPGHHQGHSHAQPHSHAPDESAHTHTETVPAAAAPSVATPAGADATKAAPEATKPEVTQASPTATPAVSVEATEAAPPAQSQGHMDGHSGHTHSPRHSHGTGQHAH